MIITVHNTSKIVQVNGIPALIWEGETDSGIKVHCFITSIAVPDSADTTQFELELQLVSAPSAEVECYPSHLVL